jgi:hypothetical protein
MAGMLLILAALSAMVLVYIMTAKREQVSQTTAVPAEPVDPFAGMRYSDDHAAKGPKDDASVLEAAEITELLSSVEFESKLDSWEQARVLQGQAKELMESFQVLRQDGDPSWRDQAREARGLYEEAVQRADVYYQELTAAIGSSAYQATRVEKLLQAWRRDLIGLHKTVGR